MSKQVLFTMFGATGDLAKRKLYPALFQLYKKGEIAENFAVIGTARRPWTDEYYRQIVIESLSGLSSMPSKSSEIGSEKSTILPATKFSIWLWHHNFSQSLLTTSNQKRF